MNGSCWYYAHKIKTSVYPGKPVLCLLTSSRSQGNKKVAVSTFVYPYFLVYLILQRIDSSKLWSLVRSPNDGSLRLQMI